MHLTLKSLQTEMRSSFKQMSLRVGELNVNLHERIDRLSLNLDKHIQETAYNFRRIDERFEEIDERFKAIDERFDRLPGEIADTFVPYFDNIEKMLANHEDRITTIEQKH